MILRLLTRISVGLFAVCLLTTATTFAVGVKPLRTEMAIEPGASATATIEVINEENHAITVTPDIGIYTHNDENGFPIRADLDINDGRNISSWISFSEDEIILQAGEKREVSFQVSVPRDAEPGGRYGSLIYTPVVEVNEDQVAVATRVASLLLITVAGEEVLTGELTRFDLQQAEIHGDRPFAFAVGLRNTGNIHIKPTGTISLTNEAGEKLTGIARYLDRQTNEEVITDEIPVNILGGNILPDSTRVFQPEWSDNIAAGSYTADLSLIYGADVQPLTSSFQFSFHPVLNVDSFELVSTTEQSDFILRLANTGDTYERPSGMITIMNDFDFVVGEVGIPDDLAYIAPGETVDVVIPWITKDLPNGSYVAHLAAVYGPADTPLTAKTSFGDSFFASIVGVLTLLGIGVLLIGGASWYLLRHRKPMFEAHISNDK